MQETKRCTKCGEEYPLTAEYFYRNKSRYTGFSHRCKTCERERMRIYHQNNRESVLERMRCWREANPEYERQWREANREKEYERCKRWSKNNPEKRKEINRRWVKSNRDKVRRNHRQWHRANPDKERIYNAARSFKRRFRKRSLPHTLTVNDWYHALTYFNGCCAVCGRQLNDLFGEHTAAMDHWIPLASDDCPGTIPQNIIPLCHGIDGCNNKKSSKDPETWLIETYGTRKARQIMARIQAYFDSLPGSTDEDQCAA